jgi:tRNA modification GTPase
MEDTIAAISTPIGEGGISIVRMSGPRALEIADHFFSSSQGRVSTFLTHTVHFGKIVHSDRTIDHVMLTVMRAPRSYTTEDTVEVNCHGGILNARAILSMCLKCGARLAQPGEFTKRAFLNGRLDLTQAEGVMDLISAKTERAQAAAVQALEGHLSKQIQTLRDRLMTVLAHIEAQIDFPEEDISTDNRTRLVGELNSIADTLDLLLRTAGEGRILRDGVFVAIIGRPNVGKSSLLNALLGEERSIVTAIPGTTRDTIQEYANIRGLPMKLTDTAGFRIARGTVESHGINRSLKALSNSDLILHVLDSSRPFSLEDERLRSLCNSRRVIRVLNKIDLQSRLRLPAGFPEDETVQASCVTGSGIEDVRSLLESSALNGIARPCNQEVAVNERQADAIRLSINYLTLAKRDLEADLSLEFPAQNLRSCVGAIGEIVGKTSTEDLLERVFSSFCIGK